MYVIAWILLGVVAGVVANQFAAKRSVGLVTDALLGIAGAAVAGLAFKMLAEREAGLGLSGLFVSLIGAGVVLIASSAIARHGAPARARNLPTKRVRR